MIAPLPPLLLRGDCLVELRRIPADSVDSVVCDPPYGLEFMGKAWDNFGGGFNGGGTSATKNAPSFTSEPNATCAKCGGRMRGAKSCACAEPDFRVKGEPTRRGGSNHAAMLAFEEWTAKWAAECLRILKPGGHLLAFGGSRTWHRLAAGIEDAGFEIRDSIAWLYGSGFPKSMDVSKAINKAACATREVVGKADRKSGPGRHMTALAGRYGESVTPDITAPATPDAERWQGWGTALKPAFEPVVVARKPLGEKTVAANVLAYGTGALNIDATRIGGEGGTKAVDFGETAGTMYGGGKGKPRNAIGTLDGRGRWPANVVLDESQAAALDAQAPKTGAAAKASGPTLRGRHDTAVAYGARNGLEGEPAFHGDTGGASRFFYVAPIDELEERFIYGAKAPKSERPVVDGVAHPTVKSLKVMRWLIRLVTPPGGVVVDPFAGSGTTLEAAYLEGFESIGVEMTPEYWPLIAARIERVTK